MILALEWPAVGPAWAGPESALLAGQAAAPDSQVILASDWPQLAHDPQRTGASPQTVAGPYRFYWRLTGVPIASRAQPVVVGGRLFVGGLDGAMYALDATFDAQGGQPPVLWRHDLASPIRAGAGVDGAVVVVGTHHGQLTGLDVATGQTRWSVQTGGAILAAPLIVSGTAYVGSADGSLYAVQTLDGSLLWRRPLGAPVLGSAALSADGRRVLVVAENAVAYALDATSGAIVWQTQLQGQSGADRWPVVAGDMVVFRTMPILGFHDLLQRGDSVLDLAGPRLSDWTADWSMIRPALVQHLTANPADQTFFALDSATGQSRGVAPLLYTYGDNDPPAPPAVSGGQLYLPYRARHGIQNDSPTAVHVTTRYDAELGRMDPTSLDVAGLTSPTTFNYQLRLTSDEPAILTVAGDLLLVDNWERLGAISLSSGAMVGIAQAAHESPCYPSLVANNNLMPFYDSCPFPRPLIGEGNTRTGAVVAAGRIFWTAAGPPTFSNGLAAIGPANGVTDPPMPPAPAPPTTGPLPGPTPPASGALPGYVWTEPQRPAPLPPADLVQRLEDEVSRMVATTDHLMPFYLQRGFHGTGSWPPEVPTGKSEPAQVADSNVFWYDPGELVLTLSSAYPYLSPATQAKVRAFLQAEMTRFPPLYDLPAQPDSWLKQGRAREPYAVPNRGALTVWPPPGRPIQTLYALWAYGRYTGDWAYVSSHWADARALFLDRSGAIDSYAEIAGAIGYARIARQLGDSTEAAAGESAAVAAMQNGLNFGGWLASANALFPPDPNRPAEPPGRRGAVFFGLSPEVGRYLRDTNGPAVARTIGDVAGYPEGSYLWYATRLGTQAELGETGYHSPEIGWSIFLAQAYARGAGQADLRRWLDRPWGLGDLWYIQKLIATIEAPDTPPWTPTPTSTPTVTPTPTPSRSSTATPSATATSSPTVTVTSSSTATPSPTATLTPTLTATLTPTLTPTVTATPTATPMPVTTARVDTTVSDFGFPGVPAGLVVADQAGGELRRPAALEEYFGGPLDPARWAWGTWSGSAYAPAPAAGVLPVQAAGGAWLRSSATFSQQTLEGRVAFGAGPWQHVGFADDGLASRFAILTTGSGDTALYARTFGGGPEQLTALLGVSLGAYHDLRIVWGAGGADYYVDGALVASHAAAFPGPMYVYASNNGPAPLGLDHLRVASYAPGSAAYVSSVKDAGAAVPWGRLSWDAQVPPGTGLALETRSSADNLSWSGWSAVAASGDPIASPPGRYLQYRATLASSASDSPRLDLVAYTDGLATPTPTPTPSTTPTPTASLAATVTATATATPTASVTAIPTETSTASPSATATASASETPTASSTATATASPTGTPTAPPTLTPTATATDTVTATATATPTGTTTSTGTSTATATDTATATGTPTPTATPMPITTARVDTSAADFGLGVVPAGLVVADQAGGELRRPAALEEYFGGPLDPIRWAWGTWNGTSYSPAPAGGALVVQSAGGSAWLRSSAAFDKQTLEGRVAFGAGPWQHVGWATEGFAYRWAMLSTAEDGAALYARTYSDGLETRTALPGVALGAYHDLRIVWGAGGADYYVDGALVASHAAVLTSPMYAYASNNGPAPLGLDHLRVASYPPGPGVYVSSVKDAGAAVPWGRLSWDAQAPPGTGLSLETRSSADGLGWSDWAAVAASGDPIGSPPGRYLQYRATLSSSASESPRLDLVAYTDGLATPTPTPTASGTPTASPTPSLTATATETPTASPTASPTPTPTATPTASATPSPTASPS
ncbi:MAG TPA: PQQ-binding-like beta-propeller repeat protein, partial [Chloroflexota bacterium]